MASVKLSTKAVGSIVKLSVNGTKRNFIVVHQGKPSSIYDESCNGTWLLMEDIYENRVWQSGNVNKYESSDIITWLNNTFKGLLDSKIQAAIKTVKIPYRQNGGSGGTDRNGANGLSTKILLLSGYEVGFTTSTNQYFPVDGARLSYFEDGTGTSALNKRIAKLNGSAGIWWLRSPYANNTNYVWSVYTGGGYYNNVAGNSYGVRPALVLPSDLSVSDDGSVQTNTPPTVSSVSGASGVNLGTKNTPFNLIYTPSDADGNTLTVTEKLDGAVMKTRTNVASGTSLTFECASNAGMFQKILNGSHTITIEVSDGSDTATYTATFTKSVTQATITLTSPLTVAGDIDVAILSVTGEIPIDANYTVEATNNANDPTPVWQNVTAQVRSGSNIVFDNQTIHNGAAFNFRIIVSRGSSNTGGYISAVAGAFQ